MYALNPARWKAHGRLPIHQIELFLLSLTVETLQAKICRSQHFSKGVGHFQLKYETEASVYHQPLLVSVN